MMKFIRTIVGVTSMAAVATAASVMAAPAASADREACYARGGYSFQHETNGSSRYIHAYRGNSCGGGQISYGQATRNTRTNTISIQARDVDCDSTGISLYTHGPSRTDSSCAAPGSIGTYNIDDFDPPRNFWIRVGGVNSNAMWMP